VDYVFSAVIGYLFGCVNMSYILGKLKGFDIRSRGSNNAGASNAVVTMGFKAGIITALWDILKAFLAAFISKKLFPNTEYVYIIAGAMAIAGHIFPFWMGFKGGKGLASLMGLILATDYRLFLAFGVLIILITLITDYIAIGTLATAIGYPIYMIIFVGGIIITVTVSAIALLMICKHFVNLRRIASGEEIGLSQTLGKKKR